jgi:hypothetical protein
MNHEELKTKNINWNKIQLIKKTHSFLDEDFNWDLTIEEVSISFSVVLNWNDIFNSCNFLEVLQEFHYASQDLYFNYIKYEI